MALPESIALNEMRQADVPLEEEDAITPESNEEVPCMSKTNWSSIVAATISIFIIYTESIFVQILGFLYLQQIDPTTTLIFYGWVQGISSAAQVLFATVFTVWSYKWHTVKAPLLCGRVIALIASIIFIFGKHLPYPKYILSGSYVLFAIGGTSYFVQRSASQDRSRVFGLSNIATSLSVVLSPVIQLPFSLLPYPGHELVLGLSVNEFSGPILSTVVGNLAVIGLIIFIMKEPPASGASSDIDSWKFSLSDLRRKWAIIKSLDVSWPAILVCIMEYSLINMTAGVLYSILEPLIMATTGWDNNSVIKYTTIFYSLLGTFAMITAAVLMSNCTSTRAKPRFLVVLSLVLSMSYNLLSYPFPGIGNKLPAYNATIKSGCDCQLYTWCSWSIASNIWLLLPGAVILLSISTTIGEMEIDIIYSKLLENTDQTILQSMMAISKNIFSIVLPIYSAKIFTSYGQSVLWITNGLFCVLALLLWIPCYSKFL